MKTILIGLFFMTQSALAAVPQSTSPAKVYDLSSIIKNGEKVEAGNKAVITGTLTQTIDTDMLMISVTKSAKCTVNQACPMYIENILTESVKITEVKPLSCSTVYVAEIDQRPVDGKYVKIEFESFEDSIDHCAFFVKPVPHATVTESYYGFFGAPGAPSEKKVTNVYELYF